MAQGSITSKTTLQKNPKETSETLKTGPTVTEMEKFMQTGAT